MPKKTRKMKQRAAMRRAVQDSDVQEMSNEPADGVEVEPGPVRMRPTTFGPSRSAVSLEQYDYSHIYGDLRRIALFAGFFFLVLIVLTFVIK